MRDLLTWGTLEMFAACVVAGCGFSVWRDQGYPWNAKVLPSLLIVIDLAAAVSYGVEGGFAAWRNVVYWCAAASLTYVVTY